MVRYRQPSDRNEAMRQVESLTATCRDLLAIASHEPDSEVRRALRSSFEKVNRIRLQTARDWGLIGYAMALNGATESQIARVLDTEGV